MAKRAKPDLNFMQIDQMMYQFYNTSATIESFIDACMKAFSWTERQAIQNSKLIVDTMKKKGVDIGTLKTKKKKITRRTKK
jgi:hypothetical protein